MSKEPCRHLSNLIPRLEDGKLSQVTRETYLMNNDTPDLDEYEEGCHNIERKLKNSGFTPTETYLIMDRFVSGLSIKELAIKYGTSSNVIAKRLEALRLQLKEIKDVFNESI